MKNPPNHCLDSLIQKLIRYYTLSSPHEERISIKNESTILAWQRGKNIVRSGREWAVSDLELYLSFSVAVLTHACLLVPSSQFGGGCETSLRSSSTVGAVIFGRVRIFVASVKLSSFHRRISYPTDHFLSFLSHVHCLNGLSVWIASSQSDPVSDLLLIDFYFQPGHPLLCLPRIYHSFLSLTMLNSILFLQCVSFVFHQKISVGNKAQSNGVPNYFTIEEQYFQSHLLFFFVVGRPLLKATQRLAFR